MHTPPQAPPGRKNDRSASREFRGSPNGSLGDPVLCVDLRYDAEVSAVPTEVNVVLALVPRVVMAPMQTTMIRASMTAYSTAVGPSSRFRKFTTDFARLRISTVPLLKTQESKGILCSGGSLTRQVTQPVSIAFSTRRGHRR